MDKLKIQFIKCHGAGNDFVMIDELKQKKLFKNEGERIIFVKKACDRKEIIGADGVLFLTESHMGDYCMRMFNPDGSEAEMCGNGLRCIGRLASEKSGLDSLKIQVGKKIFFVKKELDIAKGITTFSTKITDVSFNTSDLPVKSTKNRIINSVIPHFFEKKLFTAIGMPNPHLVTFVDGLEELKIDELVLEMGGKAKEQTRTFPNGINISVSKKIENKKIYTRTYERGIGLTYSCGTAMCASAISYVLTYPQYRNCWIEILSKGGIAKCFVEQKNGKINVILLGNATYVYRGEIVVNNETFQFENIMNGIAYIDEIQAYRKLLEG